MAAVRLRAGTGLLCGRSVRAQQGDSEYERVRLQTAGN